MSFDLQEGVQILSRTPGTLRALLAGLPDAWTSCDEGPDTWSPYDVVGHLVHGEKADWIDRTRIVLEHGESRTFEPFDRFAMQREPRDRPLADLLDDFTRLRAENLQTLLGFDLRSEHLELRGSHPGLGVVTLGQLLSAWVVHDLGHLAQISRVMAKRYTEAVGPWREYLPVLEPRSG